MLTRAEFSCIVPHMTRTRHNRNPEKRLRQREHITHDVQAPNDYSVVSCSVVDVRTSARYRMNKAIVADSYDKVRDNNLPILNNTREHLARLSPQPIQHDITPSHSPVRASTTYRECAVCEVLRKESPMR